jgi:hypothetical protein
MVDRLVFPVLSHFILRSSILMSSFFSVLIAAKESAYKSNNPKHILRQHPQRQSLVTPERCPSTTCLALLTLHTKETTEFAHGQRNGELGVRRREADPNDRHVRFAGSVEEAATSGRQRCLVHLAESSVRDLNYARPAHNLKATVSCLTNTTSRDMQSALQRMERCRCVGLSHIHLAS